MDPRSVFRGLVFGRDGPVLVETSEMVDPDKIHRFQKDPHSEFPPGISEDSIASQRKSGFPSVVGWTEIIRRNSSHPDRIPIRIQLKPLGVGPYVRTVMSDKNGQVTDQTNPFFMRTIFQPLPLAEKETGRNGGIRKNQRVVPLPKQWEGSRFEFLRPFGPGFFPENFTSAENRAKSSSHSEWCWQNSSKSCFNELPGSCKTPPAAFSKSASN